MATDMTLGTTATTGTELHEHDIDQAQLTQANAAPVVVQVPAGETVVRVQVTPGETIQLPFPIDAVVARLGDNGNLAVKVGDVTVILLGYAEATAQADVTLLGTDARPMDVAAVLASTDPNLDIQTAAGPAAGPGAAGADNNGGVFAPFDPSDGVGGLNAIGGLNPTALNYNLIQRQTIEIIENDEVPVVDNIPTILQIGRVLINEDDLPPRYSGGGEQEVESFGQPKIFYAYEGNDKYDGDDNDEGGASGPTDGTGNNDDMDKELLKQQVLIDVDFHGEVPGDLKLRTDGLPQDWKSDGVPIEWVLSADGYTLTGSAGGMPVIIIEVTNAPSMDGHFQVDVELLAPLDHPDAGESPNVQDLLNANVAFDVIDSNGSTVPGAFEATFEDDVPFDMQVLYSNYGQGAEAQYTANLIDEDDLKAGVGDNAPGDDDANPNGLQSTARVEGFVSVQFGGDGPAAVDPFKFGVTDGADTGLKTSTGETITWHVTDAQHIEGVVAGQQYPAFTVELGLGFPAGYFLFQLNEALYHSSQDDPATEEVESGFEDNLDIYIPVIATDNDGDSISTNIHVILDDDMPRIDTFDSDEGSYLFLASDESVGGQGDAGSYNPPSDGGTIENDEDYVTEPAALVGKYGDVIGGSSGWLSQIFSYNPGADGEKSHGYGLNVVDATTTLIDTQSQETITLVQDDAGTVRGVVTINGAEVTVFAVVVDDQTGEITFVQYRAVDHGADYVDYYPASLPDEVLALGSEHLQATFTVTDNDGDTVSSAVDLGDRLVFEDDGPSIKDDNASVALDDDLLPDGNEGGEGDNDPDIGGLPLDANGHPYVTGTLAHDYGSDGAGTVLLDDLTPPPGGWGWSNNGTTITVFQNSIAVLEIKLDDTTSGKYTVTQLAPIMHAAGAEENDAQFTVSYRVTDGDGDFVNGTFVINIDDDTPVVTLTEEAAPSLTVDDTTLGTTATENFAGLFDFKAGADGADGKPAYSFAFGGNGAITGVVDVETGHKVFLKLVDAHTLVGLVGDGSDQYDPNGAVAFQITVDGDGNVTLEQMRAVQHDDPSDPDEASSPVEFTAPGLVYLIAGLTDNDGDTASNMVDISGAFHFRDDGPSVEPNAVVRLDDDLLAGGNAEGVGDDDPDALPKDGSNHPYTTGTLSHDFGADGAGTVLLTGFSNLAAGGFIFGASGDGLQLYVYQTQNGQNIQVLQIEITDPATGAFKVTQLAAVLHAEGDNENNVAFTINYKVTDKDGDHVAGQFDINVDDDTPTMVRNTVGAPALTVDDTTLGSDATQSFAGLFTASAGADGQQGSIAYVLDVKSPGVDSGIIDVATGYHVFLFKDGDIIEGLAGSDAQDAQSGQKVVFVISVDANGNVTLDQQRAVQHDDPFDPQESGPSAAHLSADDLVKLTATITDKDGDPASATANIGGTFKFLDDGPSVDDNENVQLDDDALAGGNAGGPGDADPDTTFTSGTLAHGYGADGAGTTLFTSANLPGVGGFTQSLLPDGKTLTILQNGTPVVKIELTDTSNGSYTVTQLAPISHPVGSNENDVSFNVLYRVTDKDGDWVDGSVQIDVDDDTPTVSANALVQLDDDALAGGNANGTADDPNSVNATGTLSHSYGADGAGTTLLTLATLPGVGGFTQVLSLDGKTLTISQNGTPVLSVVLTNTTSGAYTVTQLAPISHPVGAAENNVQFTVNYQVTDKDGDTANGSMLVDVDDDTPTVSTNAMVQLDDDALAGGNANGIGDDPNSINATGMPAHSYGADGAGMTLLTAATLPVVGGFTQVVSPDGQTLTISQSGTPVLTVVLTNAASGAYTVTQLAAISHPAGSDENNVQFVVNYQVTDKDGDTASGTMVVDVDDDTPTVSANAMVQLDDEALAGGNANGTGDDANSVNATGTLARSYGADGAGTTLLIAATLPGVGGFTQVVSPDGKTLTISQNGTPVLTVVLTNTTSGAYSVTQLAPISHPAGSDENNVQFTVNYQVIDKDGDTANGSMVVDVDDDTPTVSANAMVQLDDDALAGGNANGSGDDANSVNATGTLAHSYGADGAGTTLLTAATLPVVGGFTQVVSPDGQALIISQNGTPVLTVILTNATSGAYTVTQLAPISHPAGSGENNIQFTVNYQVTDKDGDTASGTMLVDVDDDTPTVSANAMVQIDDDALAGGNANGTGDDANAVGKTGTLAHSYGADGAGTTLLTAATLPGVGGFTQAVSPDGKTLTISQNGTPVLTVVLTDTSGGAYTVTQLAPISHLAGSDENNVQFTVNYQVTDKDGDTIGGSMLVDVDDDTPTATNDNGGTVNDGTSVTTSTVLTGVLGNDSFGADGQKSGGGLVGVVAGNGTTQSTTGIETPIVTALGTLTLHANGTYTYLAKSGVGGTDSFTYTIEDGDGDRTTAVLTFNVVDQPRGTIDPIIAWTYEDGQPNQHTGTTTTSFGGLPNAAGIGFAAAFHPSDNEVITQIAFTLPAGVKLVFWDGVNAVQQGLAGPSTVTVAAADLSKVQFIAGPNVDADQSVTMSVTIKDNDSNLSTVLPDQTLTVKVDAVADKPTAVDITITDNDGNGLFSVNETGIVNIKANFADGDGSETHTLVFKAPAGFNITDWNGSSWTGVLPAGVTVQSVTGSSGAGWTVTFAVSDATSSVNMNINVKNTAAVASDAQFSVDAKSAEEATVAGPNGNGSGAEFTNTNNNAITSDTVGVVSARILNGDLVTNTPSAAQGDQAMILTFVQDGQPLNAYSQVVVRDTQGQQGAVLADSGFNIDPSQKFNVALENALEGHKIIVTDFNLEGVTLDASSGNIQIEHEDASGKPMGVYAQMSPNTGGTVIVTDSIDGSNTNGTHNGTAGQDYIYGGSGNDTLSGGNEDDVLNGGVGNDTLNGDAGNDILVWNGGLQTEASNPASGDVYHGGAGFDYLRIDQGALFNSTISGKSSIDFFPDLAADATVDLRGAHADGIEGILLTEEAIISGSGQGGSPAVGTKILLNASDVFNFSDNDTIYVIGSKGDVVDIDNATGTNTGAATWVQGADVTPVTGGVTFATWTGTFSDAGGSHQVTLLVDKDVTVA